MRDQSGRSDEHRGYRVLSDPKEVRRWADANDVVPVSREDAPGGPATELVHRDDLRARHEKRDWETVRREFEDRNLVLVHEREAGPGDCRLVDRDCVVRTFEGDTVTTDATEREVVETEAVERATVESELVHSEVIDSEVIDADSVSEELVGVVVGERASVGVPDDRGPTGGSVAADGERTGFDDEAQVGALEEGDLIGLGVEERRIETEAQFEEHVVETRVEPGDADVDAARIRDHVGRSDIVDTGSGGGLEDRYVETEFVEEDRATSIILEHRLVELEVVERKVVYAEVDAVAVENSDLVREEVITTGVLASGRDIEEVSIGWLDHGTAGVNPTGAAVAESTPGPDGVTPRLMGREVVHPDGETIGIVSDVDEGGDALYVEEDPSLTDRIQASLQWGGGCDGAVLPSERIREVRSDAIVVEREGRSE